MNVINIYMNKILVIIAKKSMEKSENLKIAFRLCIITIYARKVH